MVGQGSDTGTLIGKLDKSPLPTLPIYILFKDDIYTVDDSSNRADIVLLNKNTPFLRFRKSSENLIQLEDKFLDKLACKRNERLDEFLYKFYLCVNGIKETQNQNRSKSYFSEILNFRFEQLDLSNRILLKYKDKIYSFRKKSNEPYSLILKIGNDSLINDSSLNIKEIEEDYKDLLLKNLNERNKFTGDKGELGFDFGFEKKKEKNVLTIKKHLDEWCWQHDDKLLKFPECYVCIDIDSELNIKREQGYIVRIEFPQTVQKFIHPYVFSSSNYMCAGDSLDQAVEDYKNWNLEIKAEALRSMFVIAQQILQRPAPSDNFPANSGWYKQIINSGRYEQIEKSNQINMQPTLKLDKKYSTILD